MLNVGARLIPTFAVFGVNQKLSRPKLDTIDILIIKQNWNQFLLVVKATALKQQISKFYPQIQRTDASDHIYVSHWPVINVKARFYA